jgi:5,10-methylenetetrahydromethanopterin reductase
VAAETDTIQLGPNVTNPITRHPVVTASGICTVDEMSGGRAVLGVGTGDSAVGTLGASPARLSELEELVELFRALSRGHEFEYEGTPVDIEWIPEGSETYDVPVSMAASGPKSMELAGRMADQVLIGNGLDPDLLSAVSERIEAGATEAGRDPDAIDVWVYARANIAESRATAVDEIKSVLASSARQGLAFSAENQLIPEHHRDAIRELQERYDPSAHVGTGEDNPNRKLVEELDLVDFLADRFAIAGQPEQCVDQLQRIAETGLVDGILFSNVIDDPKPFVQRVGEDIIPAF